MPGWSYPRTSGERRRNWRTNGQRGRVATKRKARRAVFLNNSWSAPVMGIAQPLYRYGDAAQHGPDQRRRMDWQASALRCAPSSRPFSAGRFDRPRVQAREHLDDPDQDGSRPTMALSGGQSTCEKHVQDRRALGRTPASDRVEATLVAWREPPGPLRDVEHDRQAGALELITQRGAAAERYECSREAIELQRKLVDLQPLRIQERFGRHSRCAGAGAGERFLATPRTLHAP